MKLGNLDSITYRLFCLVRRLNDVVGSVPGVAHTWMRVSENNILLELGRSYAARVTGFNQGRIAKFFSSTCFLVLKIKAI